MLGDRPLTPDDVAAVAGGRRVALGARARATMERTRGVIERVLERGDPVYGVTRGVGALKTVSIDAAEQAAFNRALLVSHNVGHGPLAPPESCGRRWSPARPAWRSAMPAYARWWPRRCARR